MKQFVKEHCDSDQTQDKMYVFNGVLQGTKHQEQQVSYENWTQTQVATTTRTQQGNKDTGEVKYTGDQQGNERQMEIIRGKTQQHRD